MSCISFFQRVRAFFLLTTHKDSMLYQCSLAIRRCYDHTSWIIHFPGSNLLHLSNDAPCRFNSVIRIRFDHTRLIYNRIYFKSKSSWFKYCRVYTTLKQSEFWLGAIRERMADLTSINACIISTTFVELVFSELCLSLAPRVVAFRAWCNFLVLDFFIRIVRLQRTFKVCSCILKMPPS